MAKTTTSYVDSGAPELEPKEGATPEPAYEPDNAALLGLSVPEPGTPGAAPVDFGAMSAQAEKAGIGIRALAGINHGLATIGQGITGADESASPDKQFYQNMITESYAPRKFVEGLQEYQAKDLAITEQRLALERKDPTSAINRQFQKNFQPWLQQAGLSHVTEYLTIDDIQPGRMVEGVMAAEARAKAAAAESMAQMEAQDREYALRKDLETHKAGLRPKKGGGGGGGSRGATADTAANYFIEQLGGAENLSVSDAAAIQAFTQAPKGTPAASALRADIEKRIATRRAQGGQDVQTVRKNQITRQDLMNEVQDYGKRTIDQRTSLIRANDAMKVIDSLSNEQIMAALTGKGLPPSVAEATFGKDMNRFNQTMAFMRQAYGKSISGAGMSDKERADIAEGIGLVRLGNKNSVKQGMALIRSAMQSYVSAAQETLSPEARQYANTPIDKQAEYLNSLFGGSGGAENSGQKGGVKVRQKSTGKVMTLSPEQANKVLNNSNYERL